MNPVFEAATLLQKSDLVLLRCFENGQTCPAEWTAYRESLRQVISGAATEIPATPSYP